MKSPDQLLAKAVHRAVGLPAPAAIARTILASTTGAHNGLRAATYEARVRGTGVDSDIDDNRVRLTVTERLAAARIDGTSDNRNELDHLRNLSRASQRFVDAIGALDAICLDAPPPDTWETALHDANLLCETGTVTAAADLGYDVTGWCHQAAGAVGDVADVHKRYKPHQASRWIQIREDGLRSDEICDICASVTPPVYLAARNKAFLLCRHCNDLRLEGGERPTREVKQAYHHGTQLDYRRALSRWLDDCADERRAHHA